MTPTPLLALPATTLDLVRLLQDASQPPERREEAHRALGSVVRRVARCVAARHGQVGQDLEDEALSWVLEPARLSQFHVAEGIPFEAWCRRVLDNRLLDLLRRRANRRRHEVQAAHQYRSERSTDPFSQLDVELDRHTPFSAADLERLRAWSNPRQRVALLVISTLFTKVPAPLWRQFLEEARVAPPFPPRSLRLLESREDRQALLANALETSPNMVSQWCLRGREQLAHLAFVREWSR